jgi:hypothetical protein
MQTIIDGLAIGFKARGRDIPDSIRRKCLLTDQGSWCLEAPGRIDSMKLGSNGSEGLLS